MPITLSRRELLQASAALAVAPFKERPDVLVSRDGRTIAVRGTVLFPLADDSCVAQAHRSHERRG